MATTRLMPTTEKEVGTMFTDLEEDFKFHNHIDTISAIAEKRGISKVTRDVRSHTGGSSSPAKIYDQESNTIFTNESTSVKSFFNLPPAFPGLTFSFAVVDTDGLRIVANGTNVIRVATLVTGAGGYAENSTLGHTMTLTAISNSTWFATGGIGTWTLSL
jgi:hypothetical protein